MAEAPILTLDLATLTGAAIGAGDVLPDLSHVVLPKTGEDGGAFFWAYRSWLLGMIDEHTPAVIVFESPILPRPFIKDGRVISPTNIVTTRRLQGLAAITEEVAYEAGLDCREVSVQAVKKALTDYGNASKADMMIVARQYGLEPLVHDEADAFAIWLCAIRQLRPHHAARWDFAYGRPARRMA